MEQEPFLAPTVYRNSPFSSLYSVSLDLLTSKFSNPSLKFGVLPKWCFVAVIIIIITRRSVEHGTRALNVLG